MTTLPKIPSDTECFLGHAGMLREGVPLMPIVWSPFDWNGRDVFIETREGCTSVYTWQGTHAEFNALKKDYHYVTADYALKDERASGSFQSTFVSCVDSAGETWYCCVTHDVSYSFGQEHWPEAVHLLPPGVPEFAIVSFAAYKPNAAGKYATAFARERYIVTVSKNRADCEPISMRAGMDELTKAMPRVFVIAQGVNIFQHLAATSDPNILDPNADVFVQNVEGGWAYPWEQSPKEQADFQAAAKRMNLGVYAIAGVDEGKQTYLPTDYARDPSGKIKPSIWGSKPLLNEEAAFKYFVEDHQRLYDLGARIAYFDVDYFMGPCEGSGSSIDYTDGTTGGTLAHVVAWRQARIEAIAAIGFKTIYCEGDRLNADYGLLYAHPKFVPSSIGATGYKGQAQGPKASAESTAPKELSILGITPDNWRTGYLGQRHAMVLYSRWLSENDKHLFGTQTTPIPLTWPAFRALMALQVVTGTDAIGWITPQPGAFMSADMLTLQRRMVAPLMALVYRRVALARAVDPVEPMRSKNLNGRVELSTADGAIEMTVNRRATPISLPLPLGLVLELPTDGFFVLDKPTGTWFVSGAIGASAHFEAWYVKGGDSGAYYQGQFITLPQLLGKLAPAFAGVEA